jgi:hypothetical protein
MTLTRLGYSPHPPAASAAGCPPPLAGEGFLLPSQRKLPPAETERIADRIALENSLPRKRGRVGVGASR